MIVLKIVLQKTLTPVFLMLTMNLIQTLLLINLMNMKMMFLLTNTFPVCGTYIFMIINFYKANTIKGLASNLPHHILSIQHTTKKSDSIQDVLYLSLRVLLFHVKILTQLRNDMPV